MSGTIVSKIIIMYFVYFIVENKCHAVIIMKIIFQPEDETPSYCFVLIVSAVKQ